MEVKDYALDFSGQSGVPSQWGVTLNMVVECFHKQTKGLEDFQIMPDRRRGVFNVTAFSKKACETLDSFSLLVEKYGKRMEIPLRQKARKSNTAVWISVHRTCEGAMRDVPNEFF